MHKDNQAMVDEIAAEHGIPEGAVVDNILAWYRASKRATARVTGLHEEHVIFGKDDTGEPMSPEAVYAVAGGMATGNERASAWLVMELAKEKGYLSPEWEHDEITDGQAATWAAAILLGNAENPEVGIEFLRKLK